MSPIERQQLLDLALQHIKYAEGLLNLVRASTKLDEDLRTLPIVTDPMRLAIAAAALMHQHEMKGPDHGQDIL